MKQIASAFIAAKRGFGPVLKSKTNPAFKSKYANLEACLDAVDDACLGAGIALYQETFEDATGVTVETVFLHESGESLRCGKLHVPAAKQDPQGYGSALTYARRYSLLAACGIASEDDDGTAGTQAKRDQDARKRTGVMADVLATTDPLPKDQMEYVAELAGNVIDLFGAKGPTTAYDRVQSEGLDGEQMIYLWAQLPSNVRSALKLEKTNRAPA